VKDRYVISAPVTGSLARIALEVGDPVQEGATVAEVAPLAAPLLDPRARAEAAARLGAALSAEGQARAQVARARAAKEYAGLELARTKRLSTHGALTAHSLDQAAFEARMRDEELGSTLFGLKVATEEVRLARAALGRTSEPGALSRHVDVVAPVSGKILRIHHESAGVVQAGAPLLEIGDPAALELVVDVLTTDAVRIRPGTRVVVQGWGGEPLAGRVHHVEPAAFTRQSALGVDEQRVNVIIGLSDPPARWAALGDGFRVEAQIVVAEVPEALVLPLGAVFRDGKRWAVFRIEGGTARLTPIEIGHRAQGQVEVRNGIGEGAKVVVHPGDRVREGVRVAER
jgi:HlyD family secretion protein